MLWLFRLAVLSLAILISVTRCRENSLGNSPSLNSSPTNGEELYNANCLSCHGGPTGGNMMTIPPRHNAMDIRGTTPTAS